MPATLLLSALPLADGHRTASPRGVQQLLGLMRLAAQQAFGNLAAWQQQ